MYLWFPSRIAISWISYGMYASFPHKAVFVTEVIFLPKRILEHSKDDQRGIQSRYHLVI